LSWNSTCFGQFVCPSSGVYSLYTQQWYMSYRFVDSCRAGPPEWHILLLSVQWINSWWWTEELSETCTVSCQNKFLKLVHLVGFIIKKFVTMHDHTNVKFDNVMVFMRLLLCKTSYFPLNTICIFCWSSYRKNMNEDAALSVDTFILILLK
jgi:hypothetical protein